MRALELVSNGSNFIDLFRFFQNQGISFDDSYNYSIRIFRGSTPTSGPFTKNLSYAKGFILIYNFFRLATKKNLADRIPTFFVGKTLIQDIQILHELIEEGMVIGPKYPPPQFQDLSALCSWMSFSLYLNKFNLAALEKHYMQILRA